MSRITRLLLLAVLFSCAVTSMSSAWSQDTTVTDFVGDTNSAKSTESPPATAAVETSTGQDAYSSDDDNAATQSAGISVEGFTVNNLWICISAALVFIMHLGFTTLESGLTQKKNAVNIIFKNVWILCTGILLYACWGFKAMYPEGWAVTDVFAVGHWFGGDLNDVSNTSAKYNVGYTLWADFIFQAMFAATGATIVSGAVAERVKLPTFMLFSTLLVGLAYPISGSWKWGEGWLDDMGFYDFAGSSVVHAFGGFAALACCWILGPRTGKYTAEGIRPIVGHSMPLAAIGVFLLWLGWYGFNGGSALSADPKAVSYVFVTTTLGACGGAVASILTSWVVIKKLDVSMALNGILAGLVGITAGADVVEESSAIIIGAVAGVLVVASILFFDRIKIDDPVGAVSVHGVCGIWGTLAVGIFSFAVDDKGQPAHSIVTQAIGTLSIGAFAFVFAFAVFYALKATMGVRVSVEEEVEGLDLSEHGVQAYTG